ncbi:EAL domain-containing protein [Neobacillus sp. PS3-40]|uniref:sensor domain-containing protein n=1 Tax=Neobacillus sp. PS3-40 TaxID=3070679 RepID=UPI0027E02B63|nr:EAL domain-containing protein [Neobacillus sp. PS3-40]WML42870.1 EAL domain-containing protein [Neobacillus sp. PS3-40]
MRKWMLIFGLLTITVLIDEVGTIIFPSINKYKLATATALLATIGLLFFLFKSMDKTAMELRKLEKRVKNVFDTLDVAIWSHDLRSNTLLITPGIEKLYGYPLEAFYQDFFLWKKVIHPEDLPVLSEREQKLKTGEPSTSEYRIIRPGGEVRWIQDRGFPTLDEQGNLVDFNSVLFDITDRKESEDRYRSLVEMSPDFVAVINSGKIDYVNEAGCNLMGATGPSDLLGLPATQFAPTEIIENIKNSELHTVGKIAATRYELQMKKLDGSCIDVELSTMPILLGGRLATQVVGRDITKRKKNEKTIQYMAFYDTLTGIPNRNMLKKHLNEILVQQKSQMAAVLFLDLDRFKIINDTKGHTTGDLLLQKVAKRLQGAVSHEGMVSRQGGDEFIILIEKTNKEKAILVAQRILDKLSDPFDLNDKEFFITSSIGISIYPTDGNDEETLIKNAGTAMYVAKGRGKNKFQFYSPFQNGNSVRKMELENGLRKAIEQKQLLLHYQPQVYLGTGKIIGVEALIRWQHPQFGLISPSEFIPLAEETGLIIPIGNWVLRKACEQNKAWQNAGLAAVTVAVNVSVRQLQDDRFVDSVIEVLNQVGLNPKYLELEITESIMQNIEESTIILNQLKELGVNLSIDDFGTGYSSLNYLKHLPIDKIKIDKSFIDDILYHSNQGQMVKTIIDMGNHMQFSVVAEGIEQKEQADFLYQNACKIGQGFFYSKPLPVDQMESFFKQKANVEVL